MQTVQALAFLAGCSTLLAQAAPGLRLYSPMNSTAAHLADDTGAIVHTWQTAYRPGVSLYLKANGNLVRTIQTAAGPAGSGGGIQELDLQGNVVWDYRHVREGSRAHHDIELMPNGNVLFMSWEDKTPDEAIAAGRHPLAIGSAFQPDYLVEVKPTGPTTGQIVWEWHVWDHLIQDRDPAASNYGDVAAHPERIDINYPLVFVTTPEPWGPPAPTPPPTDFNHFNTVSYDPIEDWIILSAHTQNEIWIIDHSTTTEQARGSTGGRRGKGGDLLYRWGNPQAYRAGTAADQKLFGQHSPKRIPAGYPGAGNLIVFNNQVTPRSEVWELVLPIDAAGNFVMGSNGRFGPDGPVWRFGDAQMHSAFMSSCQRLANGNTLICSSLQGRVLEVNPAGQRVWDQATGVCFHSHYVERSLWASATEVSARDGGTVDFDLIPGTRHAGLPYVLTGSMSGTSPGFRFGGADVPLNLDPYTLAVLGSSLLPGSVGFVGTNGRATARFVLPGGLASDLAGTQLDHAFLVLDPGIGATTRVSNPVPLALR